MCLCNIKNKSVSDGTAVMYKVFVLPNSDEFKNYLSKKEFDNNATFLTSPFEYEPLTKEMLRGKVEYAARRDSIVSAESYEKLVERRDKISTGYVHGYADKQSALRDLYGFYARNFFAAVIVKCRIPEGEAYYDGDFDSDTSVTARAARTMIVERVEEMYSWKMTEKQQEMYGDYHVFVRKNQNACRCVNFLGRICEDTLIKDCEAYCSDYMSIEQIDNVPDLYN
jgi:hypothetical protein